MSALLVEMLGLPGAGKSSLAKATCAALHAQGVSADVVDLPISAAVPQRARVRRRVGAAVHIGLTRPRWTLRSTAQILAVHQPSLRDSASVLAQWLAVTDLAARSRARGGVQILEEGPLQTLWTLLLRSPDPLPRQLLDGLLPSARSDVVVVLDVPLDVVEARLRRRASKHSRSQALDPAGLRAELARGRELVELLASASATTPVLRLGGDDATTAEDRARHLVENLTTRPLTGDPR